jgi:hypothetical protein
VFASATFPLPGDLTGSAVWHFGQRDYGSPGSSIFDVHSLGDNLDKEFLANDVETRHEASLSAEWQWLRHVKLKAGAGWTHVNDWKGKEGVSLSSPLAFGELRLRY